MRKPPAETSGAFFVKGMEEDRYILLQLDPLHRVVGNDGKVS